MMILALAQQLIPGSQLVGDPQTVFTRVHTDTRSLLAGDFFVAIKGDVFDAHDFLAQAKASGAVAALAERGLAANGLSGLEVTDTKAALGVLAKNWRAYLAAKQTIPVIAVAGSNGKTTLTQMIASILNAWQTHSDASYGSRALATVGNFNNDIGVPLTLLRLRESHRCAVVELGMNHPGEIADLAAMTAATVAVVNNAQREHQEFMGTVEAVARENGEVIRSLPASGTAVFPADDAYTPVWRELAGQRRTLTFALSAQQSDADITAQFVWQQGAWQVTASTPAGQLTYALHMAGQHNVKNSLAATACALAAGVPLGYIQSGLAAFTAVAGRSRTTALSIAGHAVTMVDDTYNANPDSVIAAIDMLMDLPAPRLLILGDMGEVGNQGPAFHAEVGAYAKARAVDLFWTLGDLCAYAGGRQFGDMASVLNAVSVLVPPERADAPTGQGGSPIPADQLISETTVFPPRFASAPRSGGTNKAELSIPASILVKGSRFMKMERVVKHIESLSEGLPHAA